MSELGTSFIDYSSRGDQDSDSDFLVPAWNFANNTAAIANYPKVIVLFPIEMSSRCEKYAFGSNLKQNWIQGLISESVWNHEI